jgi:hypothetical protein
MLRSRRTCPASHRIGAISRTSFARNRAVRLKLADKQESVGRRYGNTRLVDQNGNTAEDEVHIAGVAGHPLKVAVLLREADVEVFEVKRCITAFPVADG